MCRVDPAWKLYDGTPIQKEEESCHVLSFFSVDHLGNTEDMNINCFFVDKTPPLVEKTIHEPVIDVPWELGSSGTGTALVSSQEAYEGDDSVHLLAPLITKYPPSNEARIRIPVDMTLGEISTISWMAMVIDGYIPHVDIIIDTDGDGVKDDALVVEYDKVQPPSDQLLANMNYQTGVWVDTFDDKGIVDDTAGMWLNSGAPGPIGGAGFIYGKLAEWKAGNVDAKVDANTKVIALEIEVDGWIATSEAFVDLVKLNGVGMLALHWVTSDSDIEFTCDDSWKGTAPHPSEDEELCFKVSYDKDTDGYNTDEYCMRYSGAMEGDWCCVSATPKNPFTFNFNENEDSVHDLEYYCRDAVEKASPVYIQYYKVDNNPPIIEKTLNGPQVGDCPPSPESQDLCWIKDWTCGQGNGTDIIINAYDNETLGCAVDEVRCHWWYYLDGSPVKLPVEGYYTSFPIRFYQDTVHELHVECCDGLGNCKEEVETFLVDSSGPNVTKEIIGPKKIDGLVEWIDSVTTINITAVDNPGEPCAVGEDKIYYIDSIKYGPGEMACYDPEQYCGPQQYIDPVVNAYTGPISDLNESCHVLEYWAVDKLGNEGPHEYNCFFVDKTPPNITKDNGLAIPGEGEPMFITPENPYGAFHWVSQNMPITFNCQDVGPHPSGGEKLCVRVSYDYPSWNYITEQYCPHNLTDDGYCCLDMMNDGKGDTTIPPKTFSISFQEDSMHNLEYYCEDAVGKRSEMHTQYYKVDTEPPNVTKVISPPFYGDCPPEPESSDMCYVDTATAIDLNIVDRGEICAVDLVECQWRYQVCGIITGNNSAGMGCTEWSAWNTTMPIKFPEESYHYLEIECWDALGNTWSETELFVVDKTPPKIWKEYGEPHYPAELDSMQYPHWISSSTPITIYADDTDQPHPSGLKELSYRVGIVNDENCMNYTRCQEEEIQANPIVIQSGDSITIPQDSCHLIMITAVDNVGKVSRHKQCVFVDNKSPVPNKTVGEPKTPWDGKDARFYDLDQFCLEPGKCWRTTILTPINLECIDDQPHPVNHETVCFKVELDAEDATETYCDEEHYNGSYNASGDGFCCLEKELDEPFHFGEVSEHNLAYYCVDALGNKGPIDDEKFKVEETKFEIELNRKWNFISVPVRLLDDSMDEVFKDVADTVETVWTYDGEKDEWYVYSPDGNSANDNLDTMLPGWGYWILSSDDDLLVIGGSLMSPAVLPPSKAIAEGWNLIGYYGAEGLEGYYGPVGNGVEAYCALNTIGVSMWDKGFTSLWTYWEPDNPDMWKPYGKYDNMDPGAGYWILAQQDGLYAPSTTCNSLL